jgi:hypothetical protein
MGMALNHDRVNYYHYCEYLEYYHTYSYLACSLIDEMMCLVKDG